MHDWQSKRTTVEEILKRVRGLSRRDRREVEGCFWIEGIRHFVQAFDSQSSFDTVVYSPVLSKNRLVEILIRRLGQRSVPRVRVTPEQFRSISTTPRASGIGAVLKQRWISGSQAQPRQGLCWLVVEQIRSPGNLGTIIRTAEAIGGSGLIFVGPQPDPFDPAVVRAAMGGLFHLPLLRMSHCQFGAWLDRHSVIAVGMAPNAERLWTDLPNDSPLAICLGDERKGLSDELRSRCHMLVRLPMTGKADSLNVGVAAGVMMYELVRRVPNVAQVKK